MEPATTATRHYQASTGAVALSFLAVLVFMSPACSRPAPKDEVAKSSLQVIRGLTAAGNFQIELHTGQERIPVNVLHTWTIEVKDASGKPVTDAQIRFDGSMPAHGHGLPTEPRVVGVRAPGQYVLDGVKFSMPGLWEVKVAVQSGNVADRASMRFSLTP